MTDEWRDGVPDAMAAARGGDVGAWLVHLSGGWNVASEDCPVMRVCPQGAGLPDADDARRLRAKAVAGLLEQVAALTVRSQ